jgi:hypothetical protein
VFARVHVHVRLHLKFVPQADHHFVLVNDKLVTGLRRFRPPYRNVTIKDLSPV